MPRSQLTDFLQTHPFWLLDVAPVELLSLPIFTPICGFASVTAPEMSIETQDIQEGNWPFGRKVVKTAKVNTVTLTRGATFWDSDFWRWILFATTGEPISPLGGLLPTITFGGATPRKDLVLIHFFSHFTSEIGAPIVTALAAGGIGYLAGGIVSGAHAAIQAGVAVGVGALGNHGIGPFEFAARMPARAWLLHNCIPTRYKTGGDFDAKSGEVSIMELDVEPETFEEFALTA
jgi:hypothetical protein